VRVCVLGSYVCYITCFTGKILLRQNVNGVITQLENVKPRGIEPQKKNDISLVVHIFKLKRSFNTSNKSFIIIVNMVKV
jgi:hypothetical protein